MTVEPAGLDRCPKCGAAVKLGDPWCTLCYADLRPPAPPLGARPAAPRDSSALPPVALDPLEATYRPSPPDPLTAPLEALSGPTWPCTSCGTVNRMERETCSGCGLPFLSGLREQDGPLLELPVVGDISRLGRGQRFALAGAVVLVVLVLTLLLGLLFG